jgi:alpha-amylase
VAFADWKRVHPAEAPGDRPFYMMGEVYGWGLEEGRVFAYGDRGVDFFAHGYDGLINFAFPHDAGGPLDALYGHYSAALHGPLQGVAVLNYLSSHDDGSPYDLDRTDPLGAGTRLLLAPGGAQIYYGDELARPLKVPGAAGDANLRSVMNWGDLKPGSPTAAVLEHWRKLGRFRQAHPAIGAGEHHLLQGSPYVFSRILDADGISDRVIVAMDQGTGLKTIPVQSVFPEGTELLDAYSGVAGRVRDGKVTLATGFGLVLLASTEPDRRPVQKASP